MSTTPRVTICVPAFNCEGTIESALVSAFEQSYSDFECLVVDNASTDSTVDRVIAFDDRRIRLLRNTVNIGPIANGNLCIREAKGELIQFLHADDRLLPDCLSRLVPVFDDGSVGLAFARRRFETSDLERIAQYGTLHTPLEPLAPVNDGMGIVRRYVDSDLLANWIGEPTSVMVRRAVLMEVGGFSPRQRFCADMELWLRVLARSNAAWVDDELSVRFEHDGNLTAHYVGSGEAWLDRAWMLSGLAHNHDLERRIRSKALQKWTVEVMKKAVRAQLAHRDVRRTKYKELGQHVRQSVWWDSSSSYLNLQN
jgi:glycosyltransferase involved in cell wall biosynthesis